VKPFIIKNSWVPKALSWFFPIAAITIWPFIFIRKGHATPLLMNHEKIHIAQANELLVIGQILLYLLFIVIGLIRYGSIREAYKNNPFEKEAYANQDNANYLADRRLYAWTRYV
jgi:hypothetical protein